MHAETGRLATESAGDHSALAGVLIEDDFAEALHRTLGRPSLPHDNAGGDVESGSESGGPWIRLRTAGRPNGYQLQH